MIRLRVPGALEYRDLVVRVVAAACKLVPAEDPDFGHQVVSAASEAFNNAALHAYQDRPRADIELELELTPDGITLRMTDQGQSFDFDSAPEPDLDALPESGLGIYIMKACMDAVSYRPGTPNVLTMKRSIRRRP